MFVPPRTFAPKIYVFYGESGSGKTTAAKLLSLSVGRSWDEKGKSCAGDGPGSIYDELPAELEYLREICRNDDIVFYVHNGKWMDGYQQQPVVVVEEFKGWIPLEQIKRWADDTPLRLEIKNGFSEFKPRAIFFTSNRHPLTWYPDAMKIEVERKALLRRFTSVDYFVDFNTVIRKTTQELLNEYDNFI